MNKMNSTQKQTYWDNILRFVEMTFPKLESDLECALPNLQTVQPILSAQNYCPRFTLQFFPRGMIKGRLIDNLRNKENDLSYEIENNDISLLSSQTRELKNKQEKISLAIAEIGKKHNLTTRPGIIILRKAYFGLGRYTLAPKYKQFEK